MSNTSAPRTQDKIVSAAIELFGFIPVSQVKVSDIARVVGISSQGIYRYFPNIQAIYEQAIVSDMEALNREVIDSLKDLPVPVLSSEIWRSYARISQNHPLVQKLVIERDVYTLILIENVPSIKAIKDLIAEEVIAGQEMGIIRSDIDATQTIDSLSFMLVHVLLPILFKNQFGSPDWLSASSIIVATLFHPTPKLDTEADRKVFEKAVESIAIRRAMNRLSSN